MVRDGYYLPFESTYIRKDGSRVDVTAGIVVTCREPLQWILLVQDQTDQKQVLNALKHSEELNRVAVEILAEGIVVRIAPDGLC